MPLSDARDFVGAHKFDSAVSVENVNGATIEAVLGDHPTKSASWGVEASLGSLQFGQPRTLVLRMAVPAGQAPFANVALTYATTAGEKARVEAAGSARATSDAVSQSHVARGMATTGINEALRTADKTGRTQAHDQLAAVCKAIRAYCPASHAHTAALLKDLEGQALEALSKQEYFTKVIASWCGVRCCCSHNQCSQWGRHYLPSLSRAHQLMNCNNFKDPGVQVYGGKLFNELRDIADTLFLKLPPPTPSRTKSNGQAYAAPASMSAYNDSDAVCFSGSSLVLMADSSVKRCDEVVAGDVVFGGHVVRCVVKVCLRGYERACAHIADTHSDHVQGWRASSGAPQRAGCHHGVASHRAPRSLDVPASCGARARGAVRGCVQLCVAHWPHHGGGWDHCVHAGPQRQHG